MYKENSICNLLMMTVFDSIFEEPEGLRLSSQLRLYHRNRVKRVSMPQPEEYPQGAEYLLTARTGEGEVGGKIIVKIRGLAGGRFCVIEDPNGSVAALYQP